MTTDRDGGGGSTIAKNVGSLLASQAAVWAFGAVSVIIVPRHLGAERVGQLNLASAIWGIGGVVVGFGSGQLLTREMARDSELGSRLLGRILPIQLVLAALVSVVVAGYALLVGTDTTGAALLAVVGVMVLSTEIGASLVSALYGRERMAGPSAMAVVARALGSLLTIGAVVADGGVVLVAAAGAVAAIVHLSSLGFLTNRESSVHLTFPRDGHRGVVAAAFPFLLQAGALVVYHNIDVITIAALVDDAAVGWYGAADRLFGTMLFIPVAVSTALYPAMSRRWVDDPDGVVELVRSAVVLLVMVVIPISAGVMVLGDRFAVLLFGDGFAKSGDVLQVYGVVLLPVAMTIVLGGYSMVIGRQRLWTTVLLVSAAVTVPLDLVLVPWARDTLDNAAVAGAIGYVFTEIGAVVVGATILIPHLFDRSMVVRLLKAAGAAAGMGVVTYALRDQLLVIPVLASVVTYPVLILLLRAVDFDELASLGGPARHLARFAPRRADDQTDGNS